jgi:hypothetical protein
MLTAGDLRVQYGDAAERLRNIIEAAEETAAAAAQGERMNWVWASVLGSGSSRIELGRRYGDVLELPGTISGGIQALAEVDPSVPVEVCTRHLDSIETSLWDQHPEKGRAASKFAGVFSTEVLYSLEVCSSYLSRGDGRKVDEAEISTLEQDLGNLKAKVFDAPDVPDDLRAFLLRQITQMQNVLNRVRVSGIDVLKDEVEGSFGRSVFFGRVSNTPTDSELWSEWKTFLHQAYMVWAGAGQVIALPVAIKELLGH